MSRNLSRRGFLTGAAAAAAAAAAGCAPESPRPVSSQAPASAAASSLPSRVATPRPTPAGAAITVPVVSRESWGARKAELGRMERHTPKRMTLHHTEVDSANPGDSIDRAKQHQDYHMDDPGHDYPDLAYHFMVDRHGNVLEGRNLAYRGDTVTEYDPTGHFLVCGEGDFDEEKPTPALLASTAALFAWASLEYGLDAAVKGHRDYAKTSCPGQYLYDQITDGHLRELVEDAQARTVNLDLLTGARGAAAVRTLRNGGTVTVSH